MEGLPGRLKNVVLNAGMRNPAFEGIVDEVARRGVEVRIADKESGVILGTVDDDLMFLIQATPGLENARVEGEMKAQVPAGAARNPMAAAPRPSSRGASSGRSEGPTLLAGKSYPSFLTKP